MPPNTSRKDSYLWHISDLTESTVHSLEECEELVAQFVELERDPNILAPVIECLSNTDEICESVRVQLWELGGGSVNYTGFASTRASYHIPRRDSSVGWKKLLTNKNTIMKTRRLTDDELLVHHDELHTLWAQVVAALRKLSGMSSDWLHLAGQCKKGGLIDFYNPLYSVVYNLRRLDTHLGQMHDWW